MIIISQKRTAHRTVVVLPDNYKDIAALLDNERRRGWELNNMVSYFDGKGLWSYAKLEYGRHGLPEEFKQSNTVQLGILLSKIA